MTHDVQQTRWDQLVRRVAGIIGPGSKVGEVIPELFPTMDVEQVPPELLLLGGTQSCFGGGTRASIAAQFSRASITNPAGSGKLVTVDSMILGSSGGAQTYVWGRDNTVLANAIDTQVFADTRNPLVNLPTARIRSDTSATGSNASSHVRQLSNTPNIIQPLHGIMILAPGQTMIVRGLTLAFPLIFSFFWRERTALESELNL